MGKGEHRGMTHRPRSKLKLLRDPISASSGKKVRMICCLWLEN
jgi:hypothetical protein